MGIISFRYSDDDIGVLDHLIKYNEKLLSQALAFQEECIQKGLITLIPDCEKKITDLREDLADLSEQMVQTIESL
jgi:hypothetical protein